MSLRRVRRAIDSEPENKGKDASELQAWFNDEVGDDYGHAASRWHALGLLAEPSIREIELARGLPHG